MDATGEARHELDGRDALVGVLRSICDELPKHEQWLNELDAALGDGDHGQTIVRCTRAIDGELDLMAGASVADTLTSVGMAVVANAGGASGALLGSAFIAAGRSANDPALGPRLDAERVADMLDAAGRAIASRGHVGAGDKTMLDALLPAASEARRIAGAGGGVAEAIGGAADAAERGAAATTAMTGRAGRASRLGDRSLGHPDPGAMSVAMMLRAAADRLATMGAE